MQICEGEIEQNLTLGEIVPIEKYLEKTRRKTALLFALTFAGTGILAGKEDIEQELLVFGENFGMVYQLQDDLKNFEKYQDKPVLNDLKDGIYTAPIIFLAQENMETKKLLTEEKYDKVIELLNKSDGIYKTKQLVEKYKLKTLKCAEKFPPNKYKDLLLDLFAQFCQ